MTMGGRKRVQIVSTGADPSPKPIACGRCKRPSPFPICSECEMPHALTVAHVPMKHKNAILTRGALSWNGVGPPEPQKPVAKPRRVLDVERQPGESRQSWRRRLKQEVARGN